MEPRPRAGGRAAPSASHLRVLVRVQASWTEGDAPVVVDRGSGRRLTVRPPGTTHTGSCKCGSAATAPRQRSPGT